LSGLSTLTFKEVGDFTVTNLKTKTSIYIKVPCTLKQSNYSWQIKMKALPSLGTSTVIPEASRLWTLVKFLKEYGMS